MKKYTLSLYSLFLLLNVASANFTSTFQSDTIGEEPAGWDNANGWTVAADPDNASNHVLNTFGRVANYVSGVSSGFTITSNGTGYVSFDFYLQDTTSADISIGLVDVADLSTIDANDSSFPGPLMRVVDSEIQVYDGDSFYSVDQSLVTTATWYTIYMAVDNSTDLWSGTIVGGSYSSETTLTLGGGADSSFGFRTSNSNPLVSFAVRANNNNASSNAALLDNITVVPEPGTYALLLGVGVAVVGMIRRRRR